MSQVNFFMTAADEEEFVSFLLESPAVAWLTERRYRTRNPVPVRELPPFGLRAQVEMINLSIRSPLVLSRACASDAEELFMLDMFRDPRIEFSRCYWADGRLRAGRIHSKIGWCPSAAENDGLRKWYAAMSRWLKKRYARRDDVFWYGPGAAAWVANGGVADAS